MFLFGQSFKGILPSMIISCLGSAAVSYFIHNSFLSLLAGGVTFCVILAVCMLTFGANKAEKSYSSAEFISLNQESARRKRTVGGNLCPITFFK